jgi:hypothetical protein
MDVGIPPDEIAADPYCFLGVTDSFLSAARSGERGG